MIERNIQIFQHLTTQFTIFKKLTQFNCTTQTFTNFTIQTQQALATKQHITMKKNLNQLIIKIIQKTNTFVNILNKKIQLQITIDLKPKTTITNTTLPTTHHTTYYDNM